MSRVATDSEGATPLKQHIKIGITGCSGRVGRLLVAEILSGRWGAGVSLAGGTVRTGSDYVGRDIGQLAGQPNTGIVITDNVESLFDASDVVIDFTRPEAMARHVWLAAKTATPYVVGTTGLNPAQEQELADAALEAPIVYAANMSVGVNLLAALVRDAAARLGPEWDIEVLETHHKHKIDAPSGTALLLGRAAAEGRKQTLDDVADWARHGDTGPRKNGQIGFAVRRGGDVVGEHTVSFYAEGERLELSHMATNRALFAKGAIRAALWLKDQPPGLYAMNDVLGL